MKHLIIVKDLDKGERLDKVLPKYFPKISRSYTQFLIKKNKVTVNKKNGKPSFKVSKGDLIEWKDFSKKTYLDTKDKLTIIFQNNDFLVIEKPSGITIHPKETLKPRSEITILDMLIKEFPEIKKIGRTRPGIVHRLDKNTSGLLIIAKNKKSFLFLKNKFKNREIKKVYTALLLGKLEPKEATIEAPIGRKPQDNSKMAITSKKEGKEAITKYKVIEYLPPGKDTYTMVSVYPITGRTHQIRVHFSAIGHPIVGDRVYGPKKTKTELDRPFLHATKIGFKTQEGKYKEFNSKISKDLENFLGKIKNVN